MQGWCCVTSWRVSFTRGNMCSVILPSCHVYNQSVGYDRASMIITSLLTGERVCVVVWLSAIKPVRKGWQGGRWAAREGCSLTQFSAWSFGERLRADRRAAVITLHVHVTARQAARHVGRKRPPMWCWGNSKQSSSCCITQDQTLLGGSLSSPYHHGEL